MNEVVSDFEELLLEFLLYRKNKRKIGIQSVEVQNVGELAAAPAWPQIAEVKAKSAEQDAAVSDAARIVPMPFVAAPEPITESAERPLSCEELDEKDMAHITSMYSEINQSLKGYVDRVLKNYEYVGSPLFDEQMSRGTVSRIVDDVLGLASQERGISDSWQRQDILRAAAECCVLHGVQWRREHECGWPLPVYRHKMQSFEKL